MVSKCETKYCRNTTDRKYCSTCRSQQSRQRNPIRYAYNNLKANAKRRGKEFTLTLSEFTYFCIQYDYIQGKGKTKTSFSIDRMENDKGYTKDNIRILTLSDNSKKGSKTLYYDYRTGYATVTNNNYLIITNVDNFF
jgi:hypothetical protein